MKTLIIILLMIITSILATLYVLLRKEIKNISDELDYISKNDTNAKLHVASSDKEIKRLCVEIDKMLDQKQKSESNYKRIDLELKQAIADISHDLRTPLTSIKGYMQLLQDENLSKGEKNEYINIVKNRSEMLDTLITNFYDLSRLESNEYKFEFKSLNLSIILCELIALFYNEFLNKGIAPNIDIDEKVSPVIADEDAVRRVFSNLIQNAIKHGSGCVCISLKQCNEYIITTFTNNTSDLKEEDVSHLFERFFTGDRARNGKNTGLGLAIVKRLVEQMGHEIYAEMVDKKLSLIIKWKI